MEYFAAKSFVLSILQVVATRKPLKRSTLRPKYPNRVGGGVALIANQAREVAQPQEGMRITTS
jgi:hypothetical protein